MLTDSFIAQTAISAGPDFTWTAVASSRPHTDIRTGLKRFLWEFANGKCVFCGAQTQFERSQACHIVSSGGPRVRRGYIAGNIANGCGDCNDAHKEQFDIVPIGEIRHPELVPMAWPSNVQLRNDGRLIKAARNAA